MHATKITTAAATHGIQRRLGLIRGASAKASMKLIQVKYTAWPLG
jgi:hypothetical protein